MITQKYTDMLSSDYNTCIKRSINRSRRGILFILFSSWILLLSTVRIDAQTDNIILQDVVVGKVEVLATSSITLKPGFHAMKGSDFHAKIGSAQAQYSSTTITPLSDSTNVTESSSGMNYIKTITYCDPYLSEQTGIFRHMEDVQYFDGLGRLVQTINVGASPDSGDVIQPVFYDDFGREAIKTLPYTAAKSGEFRTGVTVATVNNYYNTSGTVPEGIEQDGRAYTQIEFDNSPLNRVVSQTGPGSDWATKPVKTYYITNTGTEDGWSVSGDVISDSDYDPYTLYVTETEDEEGNKTREYKDKLGRVVLKKSLGTTWLRTAYIYDDLGLLRCVVPPKADNPTTQTELCYYYKYDSRNRMIEKKIPGGGTIKMVYDKLDRLRCTQNSEQDEEDEWSFIKYDKLNRPVITGIFHSSSSASTLESETNARTLNEEQDNGYDYGYTNSSYPTSNFEVHTVTYYDNYNILDKNGVDPENKLRSSKYDLNKYNFSTIIDTTPKGQITCTMTKVLSPAADAGSVSKTTLYKTFFYDKYGHFVRSVSENHINGRDVVSNIYKDITYLLLQSKQQHFGYENVTIEKWFEYDHTGRLLTTEQKINSQPKITLNAMKYNEVGEMITKYLHSNDTTGYRDFIQKTDYQYNIRGWLTNINDPVLGGNNDIFGLQLYYNSASEVSGQNIYNGNISAMKWGSLSDPVIHGFKFSYDNLNRMLQGNYAEGSSLNINQDHYSEIITGYDNNGNIQGLQRYCNDVPVDNLDYDYKNSDKSNQLEKVTDLVTSGNYGVDDYPGTSNTYTYDANGNMHIDGAKNITIEYFPVLNLPKDLDFGKNNRLFYHYTAGGNKLIKHSSPGDITNYIGNIVYENGALSYILTDEGRLVPFGTGSERVFKYEYNLKDHLGDNRVTFMGTNLAGAVDIVQTTSYYPFGLVMSQTNGNTAPEYKKNKYLYNGKELQDESLGGVNLDLYDYQARFYDPQIGRFTTIDPLSESSRRWSPYNYTLNNPIRFIDPDGMAAEMPNDYFDINTGEFLGKDKDLKHDNVYLISKSTWKAMKGEEWDTKVIGSESPNGHNISGGVATQIFNHYYQEAGLNLNELASGNVTSQIEGNQQKGWTDVGLTEYGSQYSGLKTGDLRISAEKHLIGGLLKTKYDYINLFIHEGGSHVQDFKLNEKTGLNPLYVTSRDEKRFESNAIRTQVYHESWKGTSTEFRKAITDYAKDYLTPSEVNMIRYIIK